MAAGNTLPFHCAIAPLRHCDVVGLIDIKAIALNEGALSP